MNEINCKVIGDLLPLYAENMLSEDGRKLVEEHISACEECRKKVEDMKKELPEEIKENQRGAEDLKKFRFHLVLIILGFPVWLPLLASAAVVALSIYLCIWVADAVVWCIPLSFAAASLGSIVVSCAAFASANTGMGVFYCGCVILGAGAAVLTFFPALLLSKRIVGMTVWIYRKIRRK